MWFSFAILSSFFYAFRGILEKRIIHNVDKYILGLAIRLFALPFFFIPFVFDQGLIVPIQQLDFQFWIALFMICVIGTPIETVFYYEAIKKEEVSLGLPYYFLIELMAAVCPLEQY